MNLKDLEIFQKIVETGTVTEAARQLNYVQSNVTSRLNRLEKELHTPLFHRHRRGMSLTPEGKKLLLYSRKILSLAEEAKRALQNGSEPSGKLEIGTVETVIQLPKILSAFVKKYKKVDLSLVTGVTEQLVEDVLHYRLDGAFVSEGRFSPDLAVYEVFEEELVLISGQRQFTWDELMNEPVLCFSKGCGYRARLEAWFKDNHQAPKKVMEFGTLETILQSVIAGLGITFVPRSAVIRLEQRGLIHCYFLPEKYSKLKTVFIRRSDAVITPTLEKFIEIIRINKQETGESFTSERIFF